LKVNSQMNFVYGVKKMIKRNLPQVTEMRPSWRIEGAYTETSTLPGGFDHVFVIVDMKLTRDQFLALWKPFYRAYHSVQELRFTKCILVRWNSEDLRPMRMMDCKALDKKFKDMEFKDCDTGTEKRLVNLLRQTRRRDTFRFFFAAPATVERINQLNSFLMDRMLVFTYGECPETNRRMKLFEYEEAE
jgi:hypothetical protein